MAVKARAEVTLSSVTDVKAVYRYYLLQSSTLAKPAKPTQNPPGGSWDDTEPGYTSGSTNSLYVVDLTVFSDDTFQYSDVSLSSSYEAAKAAYNKAAAAQSTANSAQNSIDNLQVGGRNLILNSKSIIHARTNAKNNYLKTVPIWENSDYGFALINSGGEFTLSFDYEVTGITTACNMSVNLKYTDTNYGGIGKTIALAVGDNSGHFEYTFTPTAAQMEYGTGWIISGIGAGANEGAVFQFSRIKLELGNVATDWTPAPEDMETELEEVKEAAQKAQSIANGKNTVYYSTTQPTGSLKAGDIWFNTSDGGINFYNGSEWVTHQIGTVSIKDGAITADQIAASVALVEKLLAMDVTATGTITGANFVGATGSFSGKLTSTSGEIGGFTIGTSAIRKVIDISGVQYDFCFQAANGDSTSNVFFVRTSDDNGDTWEYPFRVNYKGDVWAKNLHCAKLSEYAGDGTVQIDDAVVNKGTLVGCNLSGTSKFGASVDGDMVIYYSDSTPDLIMRPAISGECRIGTGDYQFGYVRTKHLYVNGSSVTSDRKLKNHIASLTDGSSALDSNNSRITETIQQTLSVPGSFLTTNAADTLAETGEETISSDISESFIYGLKPSLYDFKDKSVLDSRIHFGFYAQDVYELLKDLCPDLDFGIATAEIMGTGDDDTPYDPKNGVRDDSELRWSLSYTELLAPLVAVVQTQKKQLDNQEKRLSALEKTLGRVLGLEKE